ncbi:hypothetical protein [Leisingera aquaemixtae]|uniref:Uncharacterized protein n=1 Tax=Leisingera aquaemixtae TaxID=1396826 RepID=A0A0P1HC21_9RHOB|nr:hypothetical protein [Leisingera aquaemixtae]CUI01119.1 hypothetical protein PHA8399_03260 [Leisingera aquaemixtae]
MASRFYIPADQVQELSRSLQTAEDTVCKDPVDALRALNLLVEDVRRLVFATEVPDELADQLERDMDSAETGLSI